MRKWMLLDFHQRDCKELFELLDDGDGEIETDEFFSGLGKMKGPAQSKDLFCVLKSVAKLESSLRRFDHLGRPTVNPCGSVSLHDERRGSDASRIPMSLDDHRQGSARV